MTTEQNTTTPANDAKRFVGSSGDDEKSWYQYIHSDEIIRQNDENYTGKHFRHKRCPFCNRITCLATLHWYNHLEKCAPPEYSMADIGELRYRKPNELRGQRTGR